MIDTTAPVVLEVTVTSSIEDAWLTFTAGFGSWWPVAQHSIGEERVTAVEMEPGVGGRVLERWDDGREHEWGVITEWDEPNRLVFSWHPNLEKARTTEIEVRFTSIDEGTRVSLEHRGWERLDKDAQAAREDYASGWAPVLELFARRAGATSPS